MGFADSSTHLRLVDDPLSLRRPPLRGRSCSRSLLRHFRAFPPRFGQADGDRLFAARHASPRAAAFQRAGLAFLHHTPDLGGRLLRIFSRHGCSPGCVRANPRAAEGSARGSQIARRTSSSRTPIFTPAESTHGLNASSETGQSYPAAPV